MSYCIPIEIDAGHPRDQAVAICGQYWRDRNKSMQVIYKGAPIQVSGESRKVTFVASDETVDRVGDVIRAKGWQLDEFRKNPVLLWGHKSSEPPIGTVDSIGVQGTQLIADVSFATKNQNPFAERIYQSVKAGIIRAVSVGFMPLDPPKARKGEKGEFLGYEFTRQSLHELSVVSVPANQNALALAKSLHFEDDDLKRIFTPVVSDSVKRRKRQLEIERLRLSAYRSGDGNA